MFFASSFAVNGSLFGIDVQSASPFRDAVGPYPTSMPLARSLAPAPPYADAPRVARA